MGLIKCYLILLPHTLWDSFTVTQHPDDDKAWTFACHPPWFWSGCCRGAVWERLFLLGRTRAAGPASLSLEWQTTTIIRKGCSEHTAITHDRLIMLPARNVQPAVCNQKDRHAGINLKVMEILITDQWLINCDRLINNWLYSIINSVYVFIVLLWKETANYSHLSFSS